MTETPSETLAEPKTFRKSALSGSQGVKEGYLHLGLHTHATMAYNAQFSMKTSDSTIKFVKWGRFE